MGNLTLKLTIRLTLFLTIALIAVSFSAYSLDCTEILIKNSTYDKHAYDAIVSGKYNKTRGLDTYLLMFGPSLKKSFKALINGGGAHWIDGGGGNGVALIDALKLYSKEQLPNVTLIAAQTSLEKVIPGFELRSKVVKSFLEVIDTKKIAKADLITDIYGAIAYSPQPDKVISQYINMLKDKGELFLHMGIRAFRNNKVVETSFAGDGVFGNHNKVQLLNGKSISLIEWIKNIKGLKVRVNKVMRPHDYDPNIKLQYVSLRTTRSKSTKDIISNIPQLELTKRVPKHVTETGLELGEPVQHFKETRQIEQ